MMPGPRWDRFVAASAFGFFPLWWIALVASDSKWWAIVAGVFGGWFFYSERRTWDRRKEGLTLALADGGEASPSGHMWFLGGKVFCPVAEKRLQLSAGYRYGHAFTCPGCGARVPARFFGSEGTR